MPPVTGNAVVFTQGGPTAVINATWVGIVQGLLPAPEITGILGAINGIDGILKWNMVDLKAQAPSTLEAIARTPASQLRSTRHKPKPEDCRAMLGVMAKNGIRYAFGIGGNDTSESLDLINDAARAQGHDMRCFHVAKTVDNDLMENDHCPGYGSAARFVANAFRGVDLDNQCFGGLYVGVCMGRHAGWLTASAALGRQDADGGPHLIYLPERTFDLARYRDDVARVYRRLGRCVVAVSEGIEDASHRPVMEVLSKGGLEADSHGNVQLSGNSALAEALVEQAKDHLEKTGVVSKCRARGDTFGYLQRSFPDQSSVDREETLALGRFAAKTALAGQHKDGSCAIIRISDEPYRSESRLVPLKSVAGKTRVMPAGFINAAGNDVTETFMTYGRPLVGDMPPFGLLDLTKKAAAK